MGGGFPGGRAGTGREAAPRVTAWRAPAAGTPPRLCRGLEARKPHGGHLGLGGRVQIWKLCFVLPRNRKERGPQLCGPASGGQGPHAVRDSPESLGSQMRSDELQPLIHCWVFLLFNHNAVVPALVIFVCVKTESLKEAQKGASIENT